MDFLNNAVLYVLDWLYTFLNSYGLAIVALTVLIRLALWPLNAQQTKSMKAMQAIQPKLKAVQDKFKDDPQKMQAELMKLYSENKFNPFSGCLPMLIQLPIFIALYGALMSPDFMIKAGNESFLFIEKLHHTLSTSGGEALDGAFGIHSNDELKTADKWTVKFKGLDNTETLKVGDLRINDPSKVLNVEPQPLIPGEPVKLSILKSDVSTSNEYLSKIEQLTIPVTVASSHELENIVFTTGEQPAKAAIATGEGITTEPVTVQEPVEGATMSVPASDRFTATIPSKKGEFHINWDVFALIVIYGLITWGYQWSNQKLMGSAATGQQAMMMRFMPLLFLGFLIFIPIPAGVMLYLVITMVMMVIQNMVMQLGENKENGNSTSGGSRVPASQQTVSISAE